MHIEIKKAKIKGRMFLSYDYEQKTEEVRNTLSASSDAVIHPDMRAALDALIPHFAFLTEEICEGDFLHANQTKEGNVFKKYSVDGFSVGGTGESEGVTLIGNKTLLSDKKVNFNSPFQKFEDEQYRYGEDLQNCIENAKK
ncbi:MAG: hypothetical protein LBT29_00420 [Flavobacteriaceae bacterium]|jgi:hypothetical protein|nr:hypothetical protein [Flavobacteriaceae bacterium]